MLLWLVIGCGADEAIVPAEGSWLYDAAATTFIEDGCGLQTGLVFADLLIDQRDADGFRLIDTNGDAFTCAMGAADFSCADRTTQRTASSAAELTFVSSSSGRFSSSESLERALTVTGRCDGADCAGLFATVTFPCATSVELSAAYDGPADAIDTGGG